MSLKIADVEGTFEFDVPIEGSVMESLRIQVARIQSNSEYCSGAARLLAARVTRAIIDAVDPDLRPPTQAQVDYTIAIARELNVNLPGEALMFRCAMGEFLDRYSQLFKTRRRL